MAEGISHFLRPEELHRLARLHMMSRYVVEGNLAGAHRSPQRGASSEFADHRAYMQGDDPRKIDWKVFGRTDRYFIRRYEDETNLRVYFVLDRSGSMGYGGGSISKYQFASRLVAALGYVVLKARDSVGLFLHSDKIDLQMEPRNSFLHLNNLLKLIQKSKPGSTTQVAQTLHQVADSIRRRALIVILSDLFDDAEAMKSALAHFRKQHHDVIVFHVLDPTEIDLPFKKGALFEDMETQEAITVDPRAIAKDYAAVFGAFMEEYRQTCASLNIDYRLARTDASLESFVRAYLDERRRLSK